MKGKNSFTNSIKVEGEEKGAGKRERGMRRQGDEEGESERGWRWRVKGTASNAHNEINFQSIAAT